MNAPNGRRIRMCFLACVLGSLVAVPATSASAAHRLATGQADGVRIVISPLRAYIVFTDDAGRLWKHVAGRRLTVSCTTLPDREGAANSAASTIRAPRRGRILQAEGFFRRHDYCRVWLAGYRSEEQHLRERFLAASVPLTRKGAVYLDEERKVRELAVLLWMARPVIGQEERGYATPDHVLDDLRRLNPKAAPTVVALASPDETPSQGTFGYYSDGAAHAATATVSKAGRKLFIEVAAGGVVRTNVMGYLIADEVVPPVPVTPLSLQR